MSRTTLCVLTAGLLAAVSIGLMIFRHEVLGNEIKAPTGPGTWKVTMMVHGRGQADARLTTLTPLDFDHQLEHQRLLRESCKSSQFYEKLPDARQFDRQPGRRQITWIQRGGVKEGEFRARYEFFCATNERHPTTEMMKLGRLLNGDPQPGQYLDVVAPDPADQQLISETALRETEARERPSDTAEALFHFVDQLENEPSVRAGSGKSAGDCLRDGMGGPRGKSRLLLALLRNRGIQSRMVTGLKLERGDGKRAHYWVEAWINDHWLHMCPFSHLYGRFPNNYLVFAYGDLPIVRGRHVQDLDYAFLVEKTFGDEGVAAAPVAPLRRTLRALSLYRLPPAEQRLVVFLLLLPVAALIICIFRNIIGLYSFGTFAPALVGLAFRDLHSMPGILVFVSILLIGWLMRRVLDRYHLLQVPRVAFMLSLVVFVLILAVLGFNYADFEATKYISLFPMVILTGMIERFWTLETEDGTSASFKTLLTTMFIAASIALVVGMRAVVDQLFYYPETLGLIMAAQLLIGRYTGFRLSELFRFRDFIQPPGLRLRSFEGA